MLLQRGYVEGETLVIEQRAADVETRLSAHAAELVHLKVAVILAEGPAALTAAATATREIPIVAMPCGCNSIATPEHRRRRP